MALYDRLSKLPLRIEKFRLDPLQSGASGGWVRHTTIVRLSGAGHEGVGEEVNYQERDQLAFRAHGGSLPLAGEWTVDGFSRSLDRLELGREPLYRRWALESAALDLALRQAGGNLGEVLEIAPRPVEFVASLGLGSPPRLDALEAILAQFPGTGFKVDLASDWDAGTVAALAKTGAVRTVDLKGQYVGEFTGPPADAEQYRLVAEGLPGTRIEDPAWNEQTRAALEPWRGRITWDAILHSVADIARLPFKPACVNMKPSRFGFVSELLRAYEYCGGQGIAMYGGGQFELGPGRGQIQLLAGLFHPEGDNDVAPTGYNERPLPQGLTGSPLVLRPDPIGFRMT